MKCTLAILSFLILPQVYARELSADRPDATESPITVEPGRYQVESTLWGFSRNDSLTTWTVAETNFKAGLTRNSDLQLVLRPWIHEEAGGEGLGDIDVRFKINLWGNDGGRTAGALMPFITLPSRSEVSGGEWEGGVIFPVLLELTEHLSLGVQAQVGRIWNEADRSHDSDFGHTLVLGWSSLDKLGAFIEYVGAAGDHRYQASLFGGITYATSEDVQWDLAIGCGITDAADDLSFIQGVTFRF